MIITNLIEEVIPRIKFYMYTDQTNNICAKVYLDPFTRLKVIILNLQKN